MKIFMQLHRNKVYQQQHPRRKQSHTQIRVIQMGSFIKELLTRCGHSIGKSQSICASKVRRGNYFWSTRDRESCVERQLA
jgi:hypothetical protein